MIGIVMFLAAFFMLLIGFPVAFTFGAVAVIFGVSGGVVETLGDGGTFFEGVQNGADMFSMMPFRIFSIMKNTILMAVPLFIFMGMVLQKTKLAQMMLESMGVLFGPIRGGVAISTVLVGALLAASTGIVGASVVAMGIISLPVMIKYKYSKQLSLGTICASGTLGQIIPPSIVLIVLGDVFGVNPGDLFVSAFYPGMALVGSYIAYILVVAFFKKDAAPAIPFKKDEKISKQVSKALLSTIPTLILIILVLGSIFLGIATPTESSAVGCMGAILLSVMYRSFSFKMLKDSALETAKITSMVFAILIGATAFTMVFTYTGGDTLVEDFMTTLPGQEWGFIVCAMLGIMLLGFFIDFIEISYIVIPIIAPIADTLGINPLWFAVLVALNLQTSFLTPPFGFSLFFLRGVAPPSVKTVEIYKGVLPFIALQIFIVIIFMLFPEFFGISMSN